MVGSATMKAGLVSITFRALSPERIIEAVADAGLRGIEWGGEVHVPTGQLGTAEVIARRTREAGLEVVSFGSYYKFCECLVGDPKVASPSYDAVLDTAEALGAPAIRIWAGKQSPEAVEDIVFFRIVEQAQRFAAAARERGLRLDFEFHGRTLTETATSTARLLDAIDRPNVRTLWQPPLQTSPEVRLAGLRQLEPRVTNLHCFHFGQNPWPHIRPLQEGEDEWKRYLAALEPVRNLGRWALIEHVREASLEAFREDAAALKTWLTAVS
ncbi:MAG: hypothetical protein E1N59_3037 [Puniceicoccaceae bacterium 5H]|nr:MAG: hypothetical protein E1N59_3037 [Puniceicoccaceae bacterium 5H]